MKKKELIEHAFRALENAYAPYSNYHVGACVLCDDGTYFYGANIENASYPAGNCGERSAVFAAYSQGFHKDRIKALAIVTDGNTIGWPCGICRQVLTELLDRDTPIYLANRHEDMDIRVADLLPHPFGPEDLK